jgi:hypothetical protein
MIVCLGMYGVSLASLLSGRLAMFLCNPIEQIDVRRFETRRARLGYTAMQVIFQSSDSGLFQVILRQMSKSRRRKS